MILRQRLGLSILSLFLLVHFFFFSAHNGFDLRIHIGGLVFAGDKTLESAICARLLARLILLPACSYILAAAQVRERRQIIRSFLLSELLERALLPDRHVTHLWCAHSKLCSCLFYRHSVLIHTENVLQVVQHHDKDVHQSSCKQQVFRRQLLRAEDVRRHYCRDVVSVHQVLLLLWDDFEEETNQENECPLVD